MQIFRRAAELRQFRRARSSRCVLVPTMGALHAGHLALIEAARRDAGNEGVVMVSIFVNPIQFDRPEDLKTYPRTEEDDLQACREAGVDVAFLPAVEEVYAEDRSVSVTESSLSQVLCGASRPGHFDGVCTVVLKLFLLTACDAAMFGEKDFQQLAIIRRMVRDLDVPVEIIAHPTLREADGLAMSSRNARLTADQRRDAALIHRALRKAASHTGVAAILDSAREGIEASPLARIDYLDLVDAETLQPLTSLDRPAILAVAVFFGEVRLIDHFHLGLAGRASSDHLHRGE